MFAYLEGLPGGSDLEKLVKNYKKAVKSHRRISDIQYISIVYMLLL